MRDLLLGKHPKDFDVATDAHPEEIRKLFKNCRLIGRRFRLAHIRFGREIIEVATFRGHHDPEGEGDNIMPVSLLTIISTVPWKKMPSDATFVSTHCITTSLTLVWSTMSAGLKI